MQVSYMHRGQYDNLNFAEIKTLFYKNYKRESYDLLKIINDV